MRGNPIGSHWSSGSFASAAGTCLTLGPEGLLALSPSRPAGLYCRGRITPVSSGRPPSTPCPRGAVSATCSNAPLGWRPPSASAASQIPEMSRRGAGADFFPAYAGLIGGMLFQGSGFDAAPAAFGAAVCAPRTGDRAIAASNATTETAKHLDISECLRQLRSQTPSLERFLSLELFAIDHDTPSRGGWAGRSQEPDGVASVGGHGINFDFIPGFECILGPAYRHHGHRILPFDNPVHRVAAFVLAIEFHENVGIRPNIFRHCPLHRDCFRRIVRRAAVMSEQRNWNNQQHNNQEGKGAKHIYHCTPPYSCTEQP